MTRGRLWTAAGLALTVLVAAGVGVAVWLGRDPDPACAPLLDAREQLMDEPLTSGDRTIDVLGDSYTQGTGLLGPKAAWPTALGMQLEAEVVVDGVGATGFTTRGFCADDPVAFGERVETDPPGADVVVVQGGVNDALSGDPDAVADAAGSLLDSLEDVPTVLVVGPPRVPAADPARVEAVDAALRQATEQAGRVYVPLLDAGIELLEDQVHPTGAGQWRIAVLVAAALESDGQPG
jgi:lysophospholipase L1-like esterase